MEILSAVLSFLMEHKAAEGALGVALLDFIFAMKSGWESNGLLHFVYVFCKNLVAPAPKA